MKAQGETPELHWDLYEFSRAKRFKPEMKFHLSRIVALDPRDEEARKRLGYDDRFFGRWVLRDQQYASHGYVRVGADWVPKPFLDIVNSVEAWNEQSYAGQKQFKQWERLARSADPLVAERELAKLATPATLAFLVREANQKRRSPSDKMMFLSAIGTIENGSAIDALIAFAIADPSDVVREHAAVLLRQKHYPKDTVAAKLIPILRSDTNTHINRAAEILGDLEQFSAVLPLINSLVTTHIRANPNAKQPGSIGAGFDSNGGTGINMGNGGSGKVKLTASNRSVLAALQKLTEHTEQNPYNAIAWRQWYIRQTTILDDGSLQYDD